MMTDALDAKGRPYRIAYSSPNASTINAAVLQGLAVATMPEICMRPACAFSPKPRVIQGSAPSTSG